MVTTHTDPSSSVSDYEYADNFLGALNQSTDLYETVRLGNYNKFYCKAEGCDKVFFFKSAVERHVSSHLEIKPYKCTFPYCEKAFKREDSLENHIRGNHTKEPALYCTFPGCKEFFTTNAKLRYHNLLHSGKRPYKCTIPQCGRSFVTSSQLRQHERSYIVHKRLMKKYEVSPSDDNSKSVEDFEYDEKILDFDKTPVKKMKVEPTLTNTPQDKTYDEPSFDNWNDGFLRIDEPQVKPQVQPPMAPETEAILNKVMKENASLKNKIDEASHFLEKISRQYSQLEVAFNQSRQQLMQQQAQNNYNFVKFEDRFVDPELNFVDFKHSVYNT